MFVGVGGLEPVLTAPDHFFDDRPVQQRFAAEEGHLHASSRLQFLQAHGHAPPGHRRAHAGAIILAVGLGPVETIDTGEIAGLAHQEIEGHPVLAAGADRGRNGTGPLAPVPVRWRVAEDAMLQKQADQGGILREDRQEFSRGALW